MALIDKASLLMVPSTYEDGTLYNVLPSGNKAPDETGSHNGYDQTRADFTFSRGSNLAATRVNADGLIEKGRENLLLQSNSFDTTWTNTSSTETSGFEGYDGTNNAWKLEKTGNGGRIRQAVSLTGVNTFSVYAKAGTTNWLRLLFETISDSYYFDLENGVLGSSTSQPVDGKIESVGNGWYRCSVTGSGTSGAVRIYPADDDLDVTGTSGNIYIQDAQAEKGLVSTPYIATGSSTAQAGILEDMPRINYDANGENGALLLEPSRTNLVSQSEFYGGSDWSRTRCGFVTNTSETLSPEGLYNASKMTSTAIQESYAQNDVVLGSTSGTYTFFAKKGDLDYCHALVWDRGASGRRQWFNLATGAVGTTTNFGSGYTKVDATIEDYGNGWYRCSFSWSGGNTTSGVRINISSGDGVIGSPINSYGYFYGAQAEASASYASSYIPTHGAAVTRGADSGISDVDSLLTSNATYSWFVEFIVPESGIGGGEITFKDAGGSSQLRIYCNQNNTIGLRVEDGGQTHFINVSVGDTAKCLFQCSNGLVKGFYNGSLVHTFTVDTGMDAKKIHLGPPVSAPDVKEVLLFNEALSDAECVTLTTL